MVRWGQAAMSPSARHMVAVPSVVDSENSESAPLGIKLMDGIKQICSMMAR